MKVIASRAAFVVGLIGPLLAIVAMRGAVRTSCWVSHKLGFDDKLAPMGHVCPLADSVSSDLRAQTMSYADFVDYYELMEISPKASIETIERVFRYLATKWHPDATENGDNAKFSLLVKAFETLRDAALRADYDFEYQSYRNHVSSLVNEAGAVVQDTVDRRAVLSLFYAKRRQDMKNPGLGVATIEHAMGCPREILEFHIWYFREKGWIARIEGGGLAITADGVDRIESTELKATNGNDRLLEWNGGSSESKTPRSSQSGEANRNAMDATDKGSLDISAFATV